MSTPKIFDLKQVDDNNQLVEGYIRNNLPRSIDFLLNSYTYTDAYENEQSGQYGYWENYGLKSEIASSNLNNVKLTNVSKFKAAVGNIEGEYTFAYSNGDIWNISKLGNPIGNCTTAELSSKYGFNTVTNIVVGSQIIVTISFQNYKVQRVSIPEIKITSSGIVAISYQADKAEYESAIKGELRCIGQEDGYITIASYGITPSVPIHCVIDNCFDYNRNQLN